LRYVIAPMLGGGAIVAAIIMLSQPTLPNVALDEPVKHAAAAQVSAPPPPVPGPSGAPTRATPVAPGPSATAIPASKPLPGPSASFKPTPPLEGTKPPAPKAKEHRRPQLYATNADDEQFPGQTISVGKGDAIAVHWVIDPETVTGIIHLRSEGDDATISDTVVEAAGALKLRVSSSTRMVLTDVRPEGERFLADLDIAMKN
jgi:hypothetical protein